MTIGALFEANGAYASVLRDYDDIKRIGIERGRPERSRRWIARKAGDDGGRVHHPVTP
ncbi:hypothetical protein EI94DRAFT_1801241 [Lactarius quietus]|nr:hypothetical protein EI94DRAFT_1801241 [Lactarius quietus]